MQKALPGKAQTHKWVSLTADKAKRGKLYSKLRFGKQRQDISPLVGPAEVCRAVWACPRASKEVWADLVEVSDAIS